MIIAELRHLYPLKDLLKLSGLARSTFYYYLKSKDTDKYKEVKDDILDIFNQNKGRYGYRRILYVMILFRSDQGWQYQHAEYQRLLATHNITQSMSRKGNCMDNGAIENFFGRLKVEMFYGEKFESVNAFIDELKRYIDYYNNERISMKLKGMSPVQYRTHSQES